MGCGTSSVQVDPQQKNYAQLNFQDVKRFQRRQSQSLEHHKQLEIEEKCQRRDSVKGIQRKSSLTEPRKIKKHAKGGAAALDEAMAAMHSTITVKASHQGAQKGPKSKQTNKRAQPTGNLDEKSSIEVVIAVNNIVDGSVNPSMQNTSMKPDKTILQEPAFKMYQEQATQTSVQKSELKVADEKTTQTCTGSSQNNPELNEHPNSAKESYKVAMAVQVSQPKPAIGDENWSVPVVQQTPVDENYTDNSSKALKDSPPKLSVESIDIDQLIKEMEEAIREDNEKKFERALRVAEQQQSVVEKDIVSSEENKLDLPPDLQVDFSVSVSEKAVIKSEENAESSFNGEGKVMVETNEDPGNDVTDRPSSESRIASDEIVISEVDASVVPEAEDAPAENNKEIKEEGEPQNTSGQTYENQPQGEAPKEEKPHLSKSTVETTTSGNASSKGAASEDHKTVDMSLKQLQPALDNQPKDESKSESSPNTTTADETFTMQQASQAAVPREVEPQAEDNLQELAASVQECSQPVEHGSKVHSDEGIALDDDIQISQQPKSEVNKKSELEIKGSNSGANNPKTEIVDTDKKDNGSQEKVKEDGKVNLEVEEGKKSKKAEVKAQRESEHLQSSNQFLPTTGSYQEIRTSEIDFEAQPKSASEIQLALVKKTTEETMQESSSSNTQPELLGCVDVVNRSQVEDEAGSTSDEPGSVPSKPVAESHPEPAGVIPSEATGESLSKPAGESPSEHTGKSPSEPAGVSPSEPAGESPLEPAGEKQLEPAGENPLTPAGDIPSEPAGKSQPEPTGESRPEPTLGSPSEHAGVSQPEPAGENQRESAGKSPSELIGKCPSEHTGESPSEPATGESPSEPAGESSSEPAGESLSEPAGESPSEPAGESPFKHAGDIPSEPTSESLCEHVGEKQPEPAGESPLTPAGVIPSEPAGDILSEPTGESQPEPASESQLEPAFGRPSEPAGEGPLTPASLILSDQPAGDILSEPTSESQPEPAGESQPESAGESPSELASESKPEPASESPSEATGESSSVSADGSTSEPARESQPELAGESPFEPAGKSPSEPAGGSPSEPAGGSPSEPVSESQPEPAGESQPEPAGESQPEPAGESQPEPAGESQPEPAGESQPEPAGESQSEPAGESQPKPAIDNQPSEEQPAPIEIVTVSVEEDNTKTAEENNTDGRTDGQLEYIQKQQENSQIQPLAINVTSDPNSKSKTPNDEQNTAAPDDQALNVAAGDSDTAN